MERLVIAGVLTVAAALVALVLRGRRPQPPTQPRWQVPSQLDRADFAGADRGWLVAVFTSATCDSCAAATSKARALESRDVAFDEIPYQSRKYLHERYAIEVVPMILAADHDGIVRASFVGVPTATDLWAAVAEARQPGSCPPDPNLVLGQDPGAETGGSEFRS